MCAWLLDNWTVKKAGRVTLANSLWIDEGLEIRPAFRRQTPTAIGRRPIGPICRRPRP